MTVVKNPWKDPTLKACMLPGFRGTQRPHSRRLQSTPALLPHRTAPSALKFALALKKRLSSRSLFQPSWSCLRPAHPGLRAVVAPSIPQPLASTQRTASPSQWQRAATTAQAEPWDSTLCLFGQLLGSVLCEAYWFHCLSQTEADISLSKWTRHLFYFSLHTTPEKCHSDPEESEVSQSSAALFLLYLTLQNHLGPHLHHPSAVFFFFFGINYTCWNVWHTNLKQNEKKTVLTWKDEATWLRTDTRRSPVTLALRVWGKCTGSCRDAHQSYLCQQYPDWMQHLQFLSWRFQTAPPCHSYLGPALGAGRHGVGEARCSEGVLAFKEGYKLLDDLEVHLLWTHFYLKMLLKSFSPCMTVYRSKTSLCKH